MSEYRLQTELNEDAKREIALHAEKHLLETKIQNHKSKISERFYTFTKVFSLLVFANVLFSFILQRPADFFVVIIYGVAYSAEMVWLTFGLRKRRKKLEERQKIVDETENRIYINQ